MSQPAKAVSAPFVSLRTFLGGLLPADREFLTTYRYLRRGIGIIGMLLPFVLPLGYAVSARILGIKGYPWPHSISAYYYTDMRNVFVGSMCAIGVFLICYRYSVWDDVLTNIAGALAVLVALCPTSQSGARPTFANDLHLVFATLLFVDFAAICLFLFTRSDQPRGARTRLKRIRDGIYILCGTVILACIILAVAHTGVWLFWYEAVAIFAFGVSWLVKGEAIWVLNDDRGPAVRQGHRVLEPEA